MGQQQVLIVLLVTIIVGIGTVVVINTLAEAEGQSNPYEVNIKEIERAHPFGTNVEIIEVKGHEYIIVYNAGIVHSESCGHIKHTRDRYERSQ